MDQDLSTFSPGLWIVTNAVSPCGRYDVHGNIAKHNLIEIFLDQDRKRWWRYGGESRLYRADSSSPGTIISSALQHDPENTPF